MSNTINFTQKMSSIVNDRSDINSKPKLSTSIHKEENLFSITSVNRNQLNLSNIPNQKKTQNEFNSREGMKVHRGPINLSSVTMRDPKVVFEELIVILENSKVNWKRDDFFSVFCEFNKSKFMIEMQSVEKFTNIYVIKFFRRGTDFECYAEVCEKIFNKLNL